MALRWNSFGPAVKHFKLLLSRRTDVDYGDFDTVDTADAEDSIRIAAGLIEGLEKARQALRP